MTGKFLKQTIYCSIAAASLFSPQTRAQEATVAGTYCLVGVREMGSCMRLSPGGKFEYFLSYGAYDEKSEGKWRLEKGELIVDSLPYDRRPTFTFKRTQKGDNGAFKILVESTRGRGIAGIDVTVTCDGTTKDGYTQQDGMELACKSAPAAVALALRMFNVAPQTINVADKSGADKVYVFEFDPGDLGKKKFTAQRVQVAADGALAMVYADSPIPELKGRRLRYERQQQ